MTQADGFEQIAQEVLKQKQLMEQLREENRLLRRQLTELREGRGIVVGIAGKPFLLLLDNEESAATTDQVAVPVLPASLTRETSPALVAVSSTQQGKDAGPDGLGMWHL